MARLGARTRLLGGLIRLHGKQSLNSLLTLGCYAVTLVTSIDGVGACVTPKFCNAIQVRRLLFSPVENELLPVLVVRLVERLEL